MTETTTTAASAPVESIDDLLADTYPPEADLYDWTPTPGAVFHCLHSGAPSISTGAFAPLQPRRAQSIEITAAMLDASRDRLGHSWLSIIADDTAQLRRWGVVYFAPGAAPADLTSWEPGSPEHHEAREEARRAAWAIPSTRERIEALREVERVYGAAPTTSRTTQTYTEHPTERAAREQAQRFAQGHREGTR